MHWIQFTTLFTSVKYGQYGYLFITFLGISFKMYLHLNPTTKVVLSCLSADTVYQVSPLSSFLPGSTMCDLRQESDLETDNLEDFSLMKSRLDSFRGSDLVRHVSAERLARAGFYFIGPPDRVRCFSCQKTVENWHTGDTPVQRHKEVVIREMRSVIIWFCFFVLFLKEKKTHAIPVFTGFPIVHISQLHPPHQF